MIYICIDTCIYLYIYIICLNNENNYLNVLAVLDDEIILTTQPLMGIYIQCQFRYIIFC